MISITAVAFILALVALLLALFGQIAVAVVVALVAFCLYLAHVAGYM